MPTELDIFRSASVLIKQHGNKADLVALDHSCRLAAKGDSEGAAVWVRIMNAVKEILRKKPSTGESRH